MDHPRFRRTTTRGSVARCPSCFAENDDARADRRCRICGWHAGDDNKRPALPLQTCLHGKYRVGRVLGQGGFGITYLCWHEPLRAVVAIKEYLPGEWAGRDGDGRRVIEGDGEAREQFAWGIKRFLEEARVVASFDHPAIVGVRDYFEANGTAYMVMEYLGGMTLKNYLAKRKSPLSLAETLELLAPVMDALEVCHRQNLLHRDVAPDNIHISEDDQAKLIDFGAARQAVRNKTHLTQVFKPSYAPIEQQAAEGKQGPWTDVYALAATFYHCVTGTPPPEAIARVQKVPLQSPSQCGADIPRRAERALLRALELMPERRTRDIPTLRRGLTADESLVGNSPGRLQRYGRRLLVYLLAPLSVGLLVNGVYEGAGAWLEWRAQMAAERLPRPTDESDQTPDAGMVSRYPEVGRDVAEHRGAIQGCESDQMATIAGGFAHQVVGGSDQVRVYKTPAEKDEAYRMELLRPYFVICESGGYYRITDIPAGTIAEALSGNVGFVPKAQTYLWPTREALSFADSAFLEVRPGIVAWDKESTLWMFMETGNKKLYPPAFSENPDATRKRERSTRPYPVLRSAERSFRGVVNKRYYNILLPVALEPKDARIEISEEDVQATRKWLTSTTFLMVFDATEGMGPFARETAEAITATIERLPSDIANTLEMGFVFYRDSEDDEKLVAIKPLPLNEAATALRESAALMTGGGDFAEPILDAAYYATHIYDWGQHGRRIMIVVLMDDAKPFTEGKLDPRVPAGLDVNDVGAGASEQGIPIIAVQAGPNNGPNLEAVLQPLAEATGRNFIRWESGATINELALELLLHAEAESVASFKTGMNALKELEFLEFDLNGYASIAAEVLDSEVLERLRRDALRFNIDPGEGGVVVREAFILENDDLLTPRILIEKENLQSLINLYAALGLTGRDAESFSRIAAEAIAAIAGEDFDEHDTISEIIRKSLGIDFRSSLLNVNIEHLNMLNPKERLAFARRIEQAGNELTDYLKKNLAELDSSPAVWMPVSAFP